MSVEIVVPMAEQPAVARALLALADSPMDVDTTMRGFRMPESLWVRYRASIDPPEMPKARPAAKVKLKAVKPEVADPFDVPDSKD